MTLQELEKADLPVTIHDLRAEMAALNLLLAHYMAEGRGKPRLPTVAEIARACDAPASTVYFWIQRKRTPGIKYRARIKAATLRTVELQRIIRRWL